MCLALTSAPKVNSVLRAPTFFFVYYSYGLIVMAYIIMAYIVLAYIVLAYIGMALAKNTCHTFLDGGSR